jgi:hypothetical protein
MVLDYSSGQILWRSDSLGIYSCLGCYLVPSSNALLLCIADKDDSHWITLNDLNTGNLIWENNGFFEQCKPNLFEREVEVGLEYKTFYGNQLPVFDTDTTMITFLNRKSIRKWNILNGNLIWATPLDIKRAPAPVDYYPQMIINVQKGIIYTAGEKTLYAIDDSNGDIIWASEVNCPGQLIQMMLLEEGMLILGGKNKKSKSGSQYLFLLDARTGDVIWEQKKLQLKSQYASNFVVNDGEAIIFTKGKLYGVSIEDGSYREIAKDLKAKEEFSWFNLSIRNDNYLVQSMQNILAVDKSGGLLFKKHLEPPKASMLPAIASFAFYLASAYALSFDVYQSGANFYQTQYKIFPVIYFRSPKYGHSINSVNYMYILGQVIPPYAKTKGQIRDLKRNGIAKINKDTGEIEDQIMLDMKDPVYDVDEVNSILVYLKEKNEIVCYGL